MGGDGTDGDAGHDSQLLFVFNFTPIARSAYSVGAPAAGDWDVVLSSDEVRFGGSGAGSTGRVSTAAEPLHGCEQRLELDLPPLGVLILRPA